MFVMSRFASSFTDRGRFPLRGAKTDRSPSAVCKHISKCYIELEKNSTHLWQDFNLLIGKSIHSSDVREDALVSVPSPRTY
jgi:hypothetical protein